MVHHTCILGGPQHQARGAKPKKDFGSPKSGGAQSEVAHKWARWLNNPCRLGGPHRFGAGGRIRGGLQVGKVAT